MKKYNQYFQKILRPPQITLIQLNSNLCNAIQLCPRYLNFFLFLSDFKTKRPNNFDRIFSNQKQFTNLLRFTFERNNQYIPLLIYFYNKNQIPFKRYLKKQTIQLKSEQKEFIRLNIFQKDSALKREYYQKINIFYLLIDPLFLQSQIDINMIIKWISFIKGENEKQLKLIKQLIKFVKKVFKDVKYLDFPFIIKIINTNFIGSQNIILVLIHVIEPAIIAQCFIRYSQSSQIGKTIRNLANQCLPKKLIYTYQLIVKMYISKNNFIALFSIYHQLFKPLIFKILSKSIFYEQLQILIKLLLDSTKQFKLTLTDFYQISAYLNPKFSYQNFKLLEYIADKLIKTQNSIAHNHLQLVKMFIKNAPQIQSRQPQIKLTNSLYLQNNQNKQINSNKKKNQQQNTPEIKKVQQNKSIKKSQSLLKQSQKIQNQKNTSKLKKSNQSDQKNLTNSRKLKQKEETFKTAQKIFDRKYNTDIKLNQTQKNEQRNKNLFYTQKKKEKQYVISKKQQIIFACEDYVGIQNFGNTCYINSFLQCLYYSDDFRQMIMESVINNIKGDGLLQILKKIFTSLKTKKKVTNKNLIQQLKLCVNDNFSNQFQQDSMEFGRQLIEKLNNIKLLKNGINKIFDLNIMLQFLCPYDHLSHQRQHNQIFLILNFQDPKIVEKDSKKQIKLTNMINNYFSYQKRQGNFKCQKCQRDIKQMQILFKLTSLPNILIIALSRFTFSKQFQTKTKITDRVIITDYLLLSQIKNIKKDGKYKLISFINHLGKTAQSGHYQAYVRHPKLEQWLNFDDDYVTSNVCNNVTELIQNFSEFETPYILFYERLS